MISEIVKKEKELQNKLIEGCRCYPGRNFNVEECGTSYKGRIEYCYECQHNRRFHKQSLINFKDYIEKKNSELWTNADDTKILDFEEDIKELTKIIERYK